MAIARPKLRIRKSSVTPRVKRSGRGKTVSKPYSHPMEPKVNEMYALKRDPQIKEDSNRPKLRIRKSSVTPRVTRSGRGKTCKTASKPYSHPKEPKSMRCTH